MKKLRITLKRSGIAAVPRHQRSLKSLGLTRIGKSAVLPDHPSTRGMIKQLRHLLEVVEVDA